MSGGYWKKKCCKKSSSSETPSSSSSGIVTTCTACNGLVPGAYKVEISGITNGFCLQCASYNGIYVCDFQSNTGGPFGGCWWLYDSNPSLLCTTTTRVDIDIRRNIALNTKSITVRLNSGGNNIAFTKFISGNSSPWDCEKFDNENIPFQSQNSFWCNVSSPICLLTSL